MGHLTRVKITKKDFLVGNVLKIYECHNNLIIITTKVYFFSEYSQMTTFLENFAGINFRGFG